MLTIVLTNLLLTAANGLTGWFLVRRLHPAPLDAASTSLAAVALGTIVNGWLALLAAEAGVFSLPVVVGVWLAVTIALALSAPRARADGITYPAAAKRSWAPLLLLAWLPLAAWLYFRPHQFIFGGADAGVYVNLAASIAESGAIPIESPLLAGLAPELYPALLWELGPNDNAPYFWLAGFYVTDDSGQITPQFYAQHPVWQAVAFAIGGVNAALGLNGLWALLGATAVAFTATALRDWRTGLLALAGMTLLGTQTWFARYPTTEPLTQFLLWSGLWALVRWMDGRHTARLWPVLAGLALGATQLVRIDMFFLWLVPAGLWAWHLLQPERARLRRVDLSAFSLTLAALSLHALLHGYWLSRPYFLNTYGYALRLGSRLLWPALGAGVLLIGVFWWLRRRPRAAEPDDASRNRAGLMRGARLVLVVLIAGLALYAWFIRPQAADILIPNWFGSGMIARNDDENLRRLAWYLNPFGVWLSLAGILWMVWRIDRRLAIPLGVGLLFTVLYIWRIQANPKHVYAARRYIPVVFPFMIVAGAWITTAARWPRRPQRATWSGAVSLIVAALWLTGLGMAARGLVSQVDFTGAPDQLATLAEALEPDAILVFDGQNGTGLGDAIGTPLHFLHGFDVVVLRDQTDLPSDIFAAQLDRWFAADRTVYWVAAEAERWPLPAWPLLFHLPVEITTTRLEESPAYRPQAIIDQHWRTTIYVVEHP